MRGHHLAEIGVELGDDVADRSSRCRGQLGDLGLHLGSGQDLAAHGGRADGAHAYRVGQSARVSR